MSFPRPARARARDFRSATVTCPGLRLEALEVGAPAPELGQSRSRCIRTGRPGAWLVKAAAAAGDSDSALANKDVRRAESESEPAVASVQPF